MRRTTDLSLHLGNLARLVGLVSLVVTAACGGDDGGIVNENEVITTVRLELTPSGGGAVVTAVFNDPDGDGGAPPTIDPLVLTSGTTYAMTVRFQNGLETPPGEITDEVRDESDQHQVFFTGTAINGPATATPGAPLTHSYADTDANGLPIGLANTLVATAGTGTVIVTLRHLPPTNDVAAKVASLAMQAASSGIAALPGDTDAQVTFMATTP
ncbi:MAG: hypothetical protein H7138_19715 [Myxococcales bacterium]|nr:hypothetical protein [Myxococcales bacterium]